MVDFMGAIKRPFTDIQTLIVGTVIMLIPIVNLLIPGYMVGLAKDTMNKKMALPKWDPSKIVDYIIKTIMVIIIYVVYMIIPVIVIFLGGVSIAMQMMTMGGSPSGLTDVMTMLMAGGPLILIGIILAIIATILMSMGVMFFVKENNLMAAFNFNGIIKKVLTGTYWISLIVAIVIAAILTGIQFFISFAFLAVPVAGFFIAYLIAGFINFIQITIVTTIFAQVFMETP